MLYVSSSLWHSIFFTGESTFVDDHGPPTPRVSVFFFLHYQTLSLSCFPQVQNVLYKTSLSVIVLLFWPFHTRGKHFKTWQWLEGHTRTQTYMHTAANSHLTTPWNGLTNVFLFPVLMYFLMKQEVWVVRVEGCFTCVLQYQYCSVSLKEKYLI